MMLHTKYQGSKLYCFRQEDFSIEVYVKHVTLGAGPFLAQGYNLNKLGKSPLGDATYQISRLEALRFQRRRLFHVFPCISLCKTIVTPGVRPFLAPGV